MAQVALSRVPNVDTRKHGPRAKAKWLLNVTASNDLVFSIIINKEHKYDGLQHSQMNEYIQTIQTHSTYETKFPLLRINKVYYPDKP